MTALPLPPRTLVALAVTGVVGLLIFLWPLSLTAPTSDVAHVPVVLGAVLVLVLVVLLVALSDGGIDVKAVALLGLLAAIGAVLRPLAAGTAGIETVFLPLVLGGRVLGPGFGFVLGSTTLFSSALLTGGVGPWLPYQMLAASWLAMGAGLLPRSVRGWGEIAMLVGYGALASVAYGLAMNFSFWPFQLGLGTELSFVPGAPVAENLRRFLLYSLATSVVWEIGRATTTAIGIVLVGRPVLATLRRGATRAGFAPARAGSTGRPTRADGATAPVGGATGAAAPAAQAAAPPDGAAWPDGTSGPPG